MATLYFCVETKEDCEFRCADSAAFWLLQSVDVTRKYTVAWTSNLMSEDMQRRHLEHTLSKKYDCESKVHLTPIN